MSLAEEGGSVAFDTWGCVVEENQEVKGLTVEEMQSVVPSIYSDASSNTCSGATAFQKCDKCNDTPAAGDKLRACSGCLQVRYCSAVCQREDWSEHRRVCKSLAVVTKKSVARFENSATGSAERNLKNSSKATYAWYHAAKGLQAKVEFLAWKHRKQSPLIKLRTTSLGADAVVDVQMIPRVEWDQDDSKSPHADKVINARAYYAKSDYRADEQYMVFIGVYIPGAPKIGLSMRSIFHSDKVHSLVLTSLSADEFAAEFERRRKDLEVPIVRFRDVHVRITGLVGAAHLNGRMGVLKGPDPNCSERFNVRLEGGGMISVVSHNYELVPRPKLYEYEFDEV